MTIFVYFTLLILLYLALRKPVFCLFLYGILSTTGFTGNYVQYCSFYSLAIDLIIIICYINTCIVKGNKLILKLDIVNSCIIIINLTIALNLTVSMFFKDINPISYSLTGIGKYGSLAFGIWYNEREDYNNWIDLLYIYTMIQIVISYLIIYKPINFFDSYNAAYYVGRYGEYYLMESSIAKLSNFYEFLLYKSRFFCCGQFGNSNTLGINCGAGMLLSIILAIKTEKIGKKILFILLTLVSFFMWTNTGERAVIYAILLSFGYYLFTVNKKYLMVSFIPISLIALVLIAGDSKLIYNYFLGNNLGGSVSDRRQLISEGLLFLINHPILGSSGELVIEGEREIFPHVSFLRIACLYGVVPGVFTFILQIIYPIRLLIKKLKTSPICFSFLAFSMACLLSNAFSCATTSLILLAEYCWEKRKETNRGSYQDL